MSNIMQIFFSLTEDLQVTDLYRNWSNNNRTLILSILDILLDNKFFPWHPLLQGCTTQSHVGPKNFIAVTEGQN